MSKELHYFNINAIAEAVRYILHYTNQEFKDVRHDFTTWPDQNIKDSLPFGQFPLYREGDKVLNQSMAMLKYVARDTDLIPKDAWEQAVVDNIVLTIYDYWSKVTPYATEQDLEKKYNIKKKILDETIDFYFSRFEKHLNANGGFFVGKLSWGEFVLCGLVESTNLFLGLELEAMYPAVKAAIDYIRNSPAVAKHIASRGPYNLNLKVIQYKDLEIFESTNFRK